MYSHFMVVLPMGLGRDLQRLCNGVEAKVERKFNGGITTFDSWYSYSQKEKQNFSTTLQLITRNAASHCNS